MSNCVSRRLDEGGPSLRRLGDDHEAGLLITSLPWPRTPVRPLSLDGRATTVRPLGQWPGEPAGTPRRLLMIADAAGHAPAELSLADVSSSPVGQLPTAEARLMARSDDPSFIWEQHKLHISDGNRSLGLAMGLRTGDDVHWWEACRLVELRSTPTCREVEMAGAIPLVINGRDMLNRDKSLTHPYLHKHNWLYGRIMIRLHANGVCEVFARHVNSRFVDDGGDLSPAVPVVGFFSDSVDTARDLLGPWDGSAAEPTIGGIRFDLREPARLATASQPGRFDQVGDILTWQPYAGFELYGGACPRQRTGDAFILRPEDQTILRGMSRTLRFSFSFRDASPRVARYLAEPSWYGLCEEFSPRPLLPVSVPAWDADRAAGQQWLHAHTVKGGFEDGAAGRYLPPGRDRAEPGWEGELPWAQFLDAWRTGNADDYELAMRSAYHYHDIGIDHAAKLTRMHGYSPVAFSVPMNRVQGPLAAYLETGDAFLFDTSEAVIETAFRNHRNAWPRLAVGRDACFVRSALMLYRYFDNPHFLNIARHGINDVVESQRPDGSFGDQGGGTGIHQYSGHMTKPWMAMLAINGVLDYLECVGEQPRMSACVRRLADWLMANRVERKGVRTWAFLHAYDGKPVFYESDPRPTPLPTQDVWHHESLARLFGYCTMRFGDMSYLEAWTESRRAAPPMADDHPISAAFQFLPWLADRLEDEGVTR